MANGAMVIQNGMRSSFVSQEEHPIRILNETGKVFQDSIHGSIEMHDLLVKIIDTPEFQRLRHLSQVAMTYLVFPGASHRRFEHSLGVCHLAAMMLDALGQNSRKEMAVVTEEDKLCVLIAALCHDLGHGPFSHTWEVFASFAGKDFRHEDLSKAMFEHMLDAEDGKLRKEFAKHNLRDREIKLIIELIDGRPDDDSSDENCVLPKNKRFLYEIVANKTTDIDTDKWDYFLRDGQSLGLKVTFDYKRLLKFTKVGEKDGKYFITFRDKERFSIEDMFRMRADLHIRAYQHHAVKKIEAMLLDALLAADDHFEYCFEDLKTKLSDAHNNTNVFLNLTDGVVQLIRGSSKLELKESKKIFDRIDRRRLYSEICTFAINYEENNNKLSPKPVKGKVLAEIRKEVNEMFKVNVMPSQTLVTTGKFRDPSARVPFYAKSPVTSRAAPKISYNLPLGRLTFYSREDVEEEKKKAIADYVLSRLTATGINLFPPTGNEVA